MYRAVGREFLYRERDTELSRVVDDQPDSGDIEVSWLALCCCLLCVCVDQD